MRAKRATLAVTLALLLTFALSAGTSAATFRDTSGHWAESTIEKWSGEYDIVRGYNGLFRPDDSITRGEMAVILDRIMKYEGRAANTYSDVKDGVYYTDAILKLAKAGVMQGSNNKMRPLDNISRQEAVVLIARACGIKGSDAALPYSDSDQVDNWARELVSGMTAVGGISGSGGRFFPKNDLSRAEAVTIFNNLEKAGLITVTVDKPTPQGIKGIDVSAHQGKIDWAAVKADGVQFALLRVGYRGYTEGGIHADSTFKANIEGATAVGIKVGVYFFSQAISTAEAIEEANFVLDAIEGYGLDYPVVFDWENISDPDARTTNLSKATLTAAAAAFCDTVQAAGHTPMVYFNYYIGKYLYDLSQLTDYDFWYARYVSDKPDDIGYDFTIWQNTSSGKVPGINGNVDMNVSYVDYNR